LALLDFANVVAGISINEATRARVSGPLKRVGIVFMIYVC
jgi:hypothetical protein